MPARIHTRRKRRPRHRRLSRERRRHSPVAAERAQSCQAGELSGLHHRLYDLGLESVEPDDYDFLSYRHPGRSTAYARSSLVKPGSGQRARVETTGTTAKGCNNGAGARLRPARPASKAIGS